MIPNRMTFRFWNTKLHMMSPVLGMGNQWDRLVECWGVFDWKDIVVMQSTGRLDIQGREMFERDVVRIDESKSTSYVGVIEYDPEGGQRVRVYKHVRSGYQPKDPPLRHYVQPWAWAMTVLGTTTTSLYENPELLK